MNIAAVDILFIVIIAIFTLRCAVRGFVSEVMSVAAMVLGLLSAIFFFRKGALIIRGRFMPEMETLPKIIAFAALFLIVFVAVKILGKMLKEILQGVKLDGLDRFLGFIVGLAEGVIVVCLLLFLINVQPFADPAQILERSFFAEMLMPFIIENNKSVITESIVLLREAPGGMIDV